ncbi:MAG: CPBP family intramembrane metalloprotease [Bacteroidota bacterium]|nr:CPBP family intramembrane metalloprotease [Bacteroidota bacterium]
MPIKKFIFGEEIKFQTDFIKPTIILLMAAIIPTLHSYIGSREFFVNAYSATITDNSILEWYSLIYFFVAAFVLMGIIPGLIIKLLFKEKLTDFGVQLGNKKGGLAAVAVLFPIIAFAFLLPAAYQKEMRDFYPLFKGALEDISIFQTMEITRGIFFYTAWEFFFRGFLLFGMRKYVGDWNAILIQTIPSCLWHLGYPAGEIFMAIPAGIMFGVLALRTRSIVYPFLLHWFIGIALDVFILITK